MTFVIVLLVLLAVLLLLLAVACIHAAMMKTRTPKNTAPEVDEKRAGKYARDLSQMLQCETVSGMDIDPEATRSKFERFRALLEKLFPLTHEKLERTVVGDSLLMKWSGSDASRGAVVLIAHADVVPASGEWKHPPFGGEIADGCVWGRGAMDNKGSLCAVCEAVETLIAECFVPPCDVYIASSCNEEPMGDGAPNIVKYLTDRGVKLDLAIDEGGAIIQKPMPGLDGNYAMLGVVEKGYANVRFTARSNGGHSSTPPKGTPLARLAAFVNEVEIHSPFRKKVTKPVRTMFEALAPHMSFPYRLLFGNLWLFSPLLKIILPKVSAQAGALLKTTCVFTMAQGSNVPNVIPEEASVTANLRFMIHQPLKESLDAIKKVADRYNLEMDVLYSCDCSPFVDITSPTYRFILDCVRKTFPETGQAPYVMLGATDARHYARVCPCTVRFAPTILTPQQLSAMHALNENLGIDALARAVEFYLCVLRNYK